MKTGLDEAALRWKIECALENPMANERLSIVTSAEDIRAFAAKMGMPLDAHPGLLGTIFGVDIYCIDETQEVAQG